MVAKNKKVKDSNFRMEKNYRQNVPEDFYRERMKLISCLKEISKDKERDQEYMRYALSSKYFGEIDGKKEYTESNGKYSLEKTIKNYIKREKRFVKKEFHRKLSKLEQGKLRNEMINLSDQMRYERKEKWEEQRREWEDSVEYKAIMAGPNSAEYAEWYYWNYVHF